MQRDCATAVCCAYIWKIHGAVVHTLFQTWRHWAVVTKVMTVCTALACTLMQQQGRSVSANISGGSKHFPYDIFRLFHSWFTALQLCRWKFSHNRTYVAYFIRLKLNFIPKNWKIRFWAILWGLRGNVCTPSIARWKALLDFLFAITEFVHYLLCLRGYKLQSLKVGLFRRGWVTSRLNFRLKGYFSRQYLWTFR